MLWPKYGFDLDSENKAKGGNTDHFDLSFLLHSSDTPNLLGVEASVSTDDGITWTNAKADKRQDGHYTVTVKNPASGYVSVRIKAWDVNGSQVEQTDYTEGNYNWEATAFKGTHAMTTSPSFHLL